MNNFIITPASVDIRLNLLQSKNHKILITSPVNVQLTNVNDGDSGIILLTQNAVGYPITLNGQFNIKIGSGVISQAVNSVNVIKWFSVGTDIIYEITVLQGSNAEAVNKINLSGPDGLTLSDTVWDDLRSPASGINPAGSVSPPAVNNTDGSLTFGTSDAVCAWFQLPHNYKEGSDIHIHIHWSKSTTNGGTVHWQMKSKWFNRGEVAPAFSALADGSEETPNSNTVDKMAIMEWPGSSGVGKLISSMVCVYLIRTAAGDTYTGNANLYEIDIHYEIDTLGSREEHLK
jgi:hypothetical protein